MNMSNVKCPKCHKTSVANSMYQLVPGGKWYCRCHECGKVFEVDVPVGRIVMMFAKDEDDEYFTDSYKIGNEIVTYHAFATPKEFVEAWKKMVEHPDGMWYWVYDNGQKKFNGLLCSGACDPMDAEGFEDYFDIPIHNKRFKVTVSCSAETYVYAPDAEKALEIVKDYHTSAFKRAEREIQRMSAATTKTKFTVHDDEGCELGYMVRGGEAE